ncbi:MAG TPA: hypothetical protein VMW50_09145 [Dehalococcoidia bacterium]|nr:hypothetical protein [Dehalococcoidia bacterium]
MKAQDKITVDTSRDHATDRMHVKIHGKVDGWMNRQDGHKLDDILNNNALNYEEKIKSIKELVNER